MSERRRFFWTCRLHTNTPPSHSGGFCRRPALSWHLWRRLHCFGSRSRLRCFRCRRCLRSWLSRRCLPEKQPGAQPYTVRFENGILMRHSTLPRFRANGLWSKDFQHLCSCQACGLLGSVNPTQQGLLPCLHGLRVDRSPTRTTTSRLCLKVAKIFALTNCGLFPRPEHLGVPRKSNRLLNEPANSRVLYEQRSSLGREGWELKKLQLSCHELQHCKLNDLNELSANREDRL